MKTRFFNIRKLGTRLLSGFALVSCFAMSSFAQVATNYTFSQSSGTFTAITGGTLLINGTSSTSLDSWTSPMLTIPSVSVNGTAYTTAYMTSNGLLKLGGTAPGTTLYTGISTSPDAGSVHICPFNADLNKALSTAESEMRWQEVGNEVVFQWKGWCRFGQTENFDLQVRINKNNGVIRFAYNLNSGPGTGTNYQPQVGIATANSAGNYINRLVNTDAGSNWNTSAAGTANNNSCRFTGATTNPRSFISGLSYIFSPIVCSLPNPGAAIATPATNLCSGASVNFSLANSTPGEVVTYQWQWSNDNVTFTDVNGATSASAVIPVTAQYYRCKVTCKATNDVVYSAPVQINYQNNVLTTTGAQRCGAGTVDLAATTSPGTTLSWYTSATGGTSIGTGSPFTTPSVSATTDFYVSTEFFSSGTAIVGAGAITNATYPNPFYSNWSNSHNQYLIRATELQASGLGAGDITSLGIKINSGTTQLRDVSIKMASTNATTVSTFLTPAFVPVYSAATVTPVIGINTLTFSTPFSWDGISNIVIEICQGNSASTATVSSTVEADNTSYQSTIHVHKTSATSGTNICSDITSNLTTYEVRPRFFFNGQVVCASPRKVVTATVNTAPAFTITNNKTVCNNAITPLTVTSTQSSYNNVTWSPVTGLFTDAAATVPYVANTHAYTVYHKSNVAGSEEYIATAQNTITLCGGIDTITLQVIPPATTAIATPGTLCTSGSSVVKISPAIPQTGELYQWQSSNDNVSFTNIGAVVNADTLATGTLTATKYFRAVVKNSDSTNCFNSTSDTVFVITPSITSATPASRCGLGTVILQAVANSGAVVNWYTAASGGTPIATGNAFTTPVLTANTNYYVSADIINSVQFTGARPAPAATLNTTPSDYGLVFNANNPFTLNSVEVYNNGAAGTVTIRLVNSGGTVLQTLSAFNIPAGNGTTPFTVPLNFPVPQGNDFRLMAQSGTASLVREGSIGGFPYTVGNVATVTNGYISGNSTTYYYFYNWKVTQSDTCASPRQAVAVTINPAPAFDITNDKTVCNNAVTTLTVTTGNNNYDSVTWSPVANLYTNAAATTAYVAGTHAATVYYKNATVGSNVITANAKNTTTQCANIDTVKIQTLPASITAKALPELLCESGTATISYTPAISQTGFTQQWSGSSDNITFADISGATSLTYTTPILTNTRYYRVTIKNSDGAVCTSSSDTVRVLHPQLTQTAAAERCGPGAVTLEATAVDGIATWYANATGGTVLGTGATFTTPTLNNTTTYYVSVDNKVNDTFSVGNGAATSSTYPNPFYSLWSNTHNQYLITAAELSSAGISAGNISSMAFKINSGTMAMQDFSVKMGNTTATNMSAFVAPAFTTVYTAATQTPVIGLNTLNFNTPFLWDGTSNVVIEICHGNASSSATMSSTAVVDNTPYVSTIHVHKSAASAGTATCADLTTNLTTYSIRPRFTFRNEFNLCGTATRTAITATIKQVPTATLAPNGNIELCEGDTQTLTASGGAGAYIWLRNNAVVTGQSANTLAVTQAAPYNVVVTGANGCTDTSAVANIIIVPKPVVNLGNDTAVCGNEILVLNAANPGAIYQWSNNSTTQTIGVTTPGQYSVTVTNNFNCIASDTIRVTHLAFPLVDLGADTVICPSQPLTLDAENTGATYAWNNGSTTQTITVNQQGPYAVTVTNADHCVGTDTINVSLVPPIVHNGFDFEPLFNIQPGRVRFTPIDLDPNYTYSWDFGDGTTSNEAVAQHDYIASGNYVVTLKISDGCAESTETLAIYVDRFTSVTRVKGADLIVKVYPNPTSSVLNVALESKNTYINKLSIFNLTGQQVATVTPENKNTKQQSIQLNNLASGAYLIKIETDKGIVNRKFEYLK